MIKLFSILIIAITLSACSSKGCGCAVIDKNETKKVNVMEDSASKNK